MHGAGLVSLIKHALYKYSIVIGMRATPGGTGISLKYMKKNSSTYTHEVSLKVQILLHSRGDV